MKTERVLLLKKDGREVWVEVEVEERTLREVLREQVRDWYDPAHPQDVIDQYRSWANGSNIPADVAGGYTSRHIEDFYAEHKKAIWMSLEELSGAGGNVMMTLKPMYQPVHVPRELRRGTIMWELIRLAVSYEAGDVLGWIDGGNATVEEFMA